MRNRDIGKVLCLILDKSVTQLECRKFYIVYWNNHFGYTTIKGDYRPLTMSINFTMDHENYKEKKKKKKTRERTFNSKPKNTS